MFVSFLPTAPLRQRHSEAGAHQRHRWPVAVPGALFAACLVAAGCLLARDLHDSTVRDTQAGLHALASLLADQGDRALDAVVAVEDGLADGLIGSTPWTDRDFAGRASSPASLERLTTSVAALPQLRSIAIVNGSGVVLASSRASPPSDAGEAVDPLRGLVDVGTDRTTVVTTPGLSAIERPAVRLSRRVSGPDGTTLGFVLAAVDLRYFERLYAAVPVDEPCGTLAQTPAFRGR